MADLRALALIYDIRGFTAASKRLSTADLGDFATRAHRVILDLFAAHPPSFVKNLGDGHLLLWECAEGLSAPLVAAVVEGAQRARTAFAAFALAERRVGHELPGRVGIGVAYGEVSRSDDYYGSALNLASRLQGVARPEGLALDAAVFAAVREQDESLRSRFRRARVRLRGLGSTVVWVDRPFAWSRLLLPFAQVLVLLALPLGYVLLCDAGLRLPGGEALRDALDGRGWSLLRAVPEDGRIEEVASRLRERLVAAMLGNRVQKGWFYSAFPSAGADDEAAATRVAEGDNPDMWSTSQAAYALLQAPELEPALVAGDFQRCVSVGFEEGRLVEQGGTTWGWAPHPHVRYTQAEPTLWTVAAVAAALRRPGLLVGAEREAMRARLARAQQAAMLYRPLSTGAWNIYPHQSNLKRHSPYATTLALLALLEVCAAGEPWIDGVETRDRLVRETADFLVASYVADASPPGWRRTADLSDKISAGLSMQVLATLLRAQAVAGYALPERVLAAIPGHLVERAEARATDDYDMGEYTFVFAPHTLADEPDPAKRFEKRTEGINFLSHPWAIDCAVRYLTWARAHGAPRLHVVKAQRALRTLVVDMAEQAETKALEGFLFVASETLIGLSSLSEQAASRGS